MFNFKKSVFCLVCVVCLFTLSFSTSLYAQDPMPDKEGLKNAFPARPYSPPV
jgi:hypothetical protein